MDIRKILFVTRFEDLRFDALDALLNLRAAALDHVVFMNVIEREKVAMRRGAGYQKEEEIKLREQANIRFIDWAENLFEKGMEVGVYIVVGGFVKQVISAAGKEEVDLIVLGPSRRGRLEQILSGSDLTEIVKRTDVPVLVYKAPRQVGSVDRHPFRQPVFATDGSPACENAIRIIEKLGPVIDTIHVIHVASEKDLKGSSAMAIQKTRKQNRQKLEAICEHFENAGIDARSHVYIGETVPEIEKAAQECSATMIITGTTGRSAIRERFAGSVPRALTETSAFPVLLIPPEK